MAGNPNWVKGVSGNPSGRAKDVFKEAIRQHVGEKGEKLVEWMMNMAMDAERDADKIKAIEWLADRGFGKVKDHVELSGDVGLGALFDAMNEKRKQLKLLA